MFDTYRKSHKQALDDLLTHLRGKGFNGHDIGNLFIDSKNLPTTTYTHVTATGLYTTRSGNDNGSTHYQSELVDTLIRETAGNLYRTGIKGSDNNYLFRLVDILDNLYIVDLAIAYTTRKSPTMDEVIKLPNGHCYKLLSYSNTPTHDKLVAHFNKISDSVTSKVIDAIKAERILNVKAFGLLFEQKHD